eukprot:scaffold6795_cov110-Skeletonema_marinoi.AAC.1
MSGRGRGRGRGGGGGPRSASQQYLLSSAQEAGFDVRNLRTSSTGMFSDFELHSSGERRLHQHETKVGQQMADVGAVISAGVKQEPGAAAAPSSTVAAASTEQPRSPETIYLISKTRELHHKFQSSVFYVRSAKLETMPDVVRYSDRLRPPSNVDAGAVLSHCLGGRKRTLGDHGGVFVPEELCGGQRRVRVDEADAKKLKGIDLDDLDDKNQKDGDDDEEKDEDEDGFHEDDGEESEGADYVANYYDSADESGGSDGEPTF